MPELSEQAKNPVLIVTVYTAVFFPWGLMYAHDFISSRWRSIQNTRYLALGHLALSGFSFAYVIFYIHVQRIAGEFTEMSAAIAAALLTFVHIARTLWGLGQLRAITSWSIRALHCLHEAGCYPTEDDFSFDEEIDQKMLINETLVDNKFTEVTNPIVLHITKDNLRGMLKRILSKARLLRWICKSPVDEQEILYEHMLRPTAAISCNMRWVAAFICQFGSTWVSKCPPGNGPPFEVSSIQVHGFLNVTMANRSSHNYELSSLLDPGQHIGASAFGLRNKDSFAYGYRLSERAMARLGKMKMFLNEALNSFDAATLDTIMTDGGNVVNETTLTSIGSFMRLFSTGRSHKFEIFDSMQNNNMLGMPWLSRSIPATVLRTQLRKDDADLEVVLSGLPIMKEHCGFPLWDKQTNYCVFQASVHIDNLVALGFTDGETSEEQHMGCIIETVRSLLARDIHRSGVNSNWNPAIFYKKCSFKMSSQLHQALQNLNEGCTLRNLGPRLLWESQYALYMALVSRSLEADERMEFSILLFVLGFPRLYSTCDGREGTFLDVYNPQTFRAYEQEEEFYVSFTTWGPFERRIVVQVQSSALREDCKISIVPSMRSESFDWAAWINEAMAYQRGFQYRETDPSPISSEIIECSVPEDLREHLHPKFQYWPSWPPTYELIAQFEIEQLVIRNREATEHEKNEIAPGNGDSTALVWELFRRDVLKAEAVLKHLYDDRKKPAEDMV